MTKTLTEQWKKGTLKDGEYYIKHVDGRVFTDWFNGHEFRGLYKIDIEEVLAPVPSYDEYNELAAELVFLVLFCAVAIPNFIIERKRKQ